MAKGPLGMAADGRVAPMVMPEQAEIARLRAEIARLKMERDIAKRPRLTLLRTCCKVRLDRLDEGALAHHDDVRSVGSQSERVFQLGGRGTPVGPNPRRNHSDEALLAQIRTIQEQLRGEYRTSDRTRCSGQVSSPAAYPGVAVRRSCRGRGPGPSSRSRGPSGAAGWTLAIQLRRCAGSATFLVARSINLLLAPMPKIAGTITVEGDTWAFNRCLGS